MNQNDGAADYLEVIYDTACIHACHWCTYASKPSTDESIVPSESITHLMRRVRQRFSHPMNVYMTTSLLSMAPNFELPREVFHPALEIGLSLDIDQNNFPVRSKRFTERLPRVFSQFHPEDTVDTTLELWYKWWNYRFLTHAAHKMLADLAVATHRGDLRGNVIGLGITHNENNVIEEASFNQLCDFFWNEDFRSGKYINQTISPNLPPGYRVLKKDFLNQGIQKIAETYVFVATEFLTIKKGGRSQIMECIINWRFAYNKAWFGVSVPATKSITDPKRWGASSLYITPIFAHLQHSAGNIKQVDTLRRTHHQVETTLDGLPQTATFRDFIEKLLKLTA